MNLEQYVSIMENITAMQVFCVVQNVTVRLNRGVGRMFLDGPIDECNCIMGIMQLWESNPRVSWMIIIFLGISAR